MRLSVFLTNFMVKTIKFSTFVASLGADTAPMCFMGVWRGTLFKDHNTPPLETIIEFGESAKKWLDENPDHICSLHCKAGKAVRA